MTDPAPAKSKKPSWFSRLALVLSLGSVLSTGYTMMRLDQNRRVMNADLVATLHSEARTNMYMLVSFAMLHHVKYGAYPPNGRVDQQRIWSFHELPMCGAHLDRMFIWTASSDGSWSIRCEYNSVAIDSTQIGLSATLPPGEITPSLTLAMSVRAQ